jgi:hypothetical protein
MIYSLTSSSSIMANSEHQSISTRHLEAHLGLAVIPASLRKRKKSASPRGTFGAGMHFTSLLNREMQPPSLCCSSTEQTSSHRPTELVNALQTICGSQLNLKNQSSRVGTARHGLPSIWRCAPGEKRLCASFFLQEHRFMLGGSPPCRAQMDWSRRRESTHTKAPPNWARQESSKF